MWPDLKFSMDQDEEVVDVDVDDDDDNDECLSIQISDLKQHRV